MKINILLLLGIFLLQSCQEPSTVDTSVDLIKKVETGLTTRVFIEGDSTWSIEERMEHYGVPGVSIAVINNGKIEWVKAYGVMDKESKAPVTEKTLFQAASISKPVTAYGALSLVEQNKVDLNENINSHLQSWQVVENEFTKEKKVTLKNLLNHSAGISVHGFLGYRLGLPVPTLLQVLNGTSPANSAPSVVDKVPEESYRYSGGGYNIIQQMMIDVEGRAFPESMSELVLQPLGMNNSTYNQPLTGEQLGLAATGYLPDGSMVEGKRHTYPEMAPAGLWTTAEDLAKFAVNIQEALKGNSEKGLSKEMTTKMLTPFVEDFIGLGIFITKMNDEIYFGHGGWNEGFSSEFIAHKDKGYGVVVLTNANQPDFISELIRSVALAYGWDDFVPIHKKLEMDPSTIAQVNGRYQINSDELVEVSQKDNQLLFQHILSNEAIELIKISDSTYISRDDSRPYMFAPDLENERMKMLRLNSMDGKVVSTYAQMDADKKIPMEFLLEGNFEGAMNAYSALMSLDPTDPAINERYLNDLGYDLLNRTRIKLAQDIFKVNTILYSESFNAYDSYAEACMIIGEIDLAIKNYNNSLRLNPQNINAVEMLKKLQKSE